MASGWVFGYASVVGSNHVRANKACEDYCSVRYLENQDASVLLVAVSDGAGTAEMSALGSRLACESFVSHFEEKLKSSFKIDLLHEEDYRSWLTSVRSELSSLANLNQKSISDFACTFIGAILTPRLSVFVQIGDGAAVVNCSEVEVEYEVISWPKVTEYANTTFFITGHSALDHFSIRFIEKSVFEVAIFTDGLQRLALNMTERRPHAPFFAAILKPLRLLGKGCSDSVCSSLEQFLDSQQVLERTDDDKTLVIASRSTRTDL